MGHFEYRFMDRRMGRRLGALALIAISWLAWIAVALWVTGVLLVGLAVGLGTTVLFGQFDHSFSTVDDLRALGLPVLGGISVLGMAPLRQRVGRTSCSPR